ncbi:MULTISPECIES: restriction endonuclease subunit S [Deinococcus]|uniref:Restriction endonuclease subunit S n=1 Tax=Deinococcus rufus TaxID=2136097 RepID=A0ABV7Z7B8_9DEIO|nr:restriction endonuclease subunit S [Deinococcus sp. AB2017081]WQE94656.1 restriction endonuclease subunit S [Deinococcus sp. AB2017081]
MREYSTTRRVSEMGTVQGGRQRSPHLTSGDMTPYLRVANVFDGYINTSDVLEMPFTSAEYQRYELKIGDLLLNEGQSLELVGRCAKYEGVPKNCCFQNTLVRFQAGHECDVDYAYQLFRWCQASGVFAKIATKTNSIAHLGSTRFGDLELYFPPLPEQRRIASILSQWDDSLSILSQLIEAKRQQKRGLAELLLTGKRRLPGFADEWAEMTMGSVFARVTRKNTEGNDHALTISGIHGLIDQREFFNKRVAANDLSGYYLLRRGEFAYNKSYSTGYDYGAIKRLNRYDAGVVSTLYICFALKREDAVSDFYEHYFEANLLNEGIAGIAQEGARNHGLLNVSVVDFFELPLPFPPPSEQQAIASVLSTLDTEIASLDALKAKVAEQKRGLMDALLTGRVRVKVEEV